MSEVSKGRADASGRVDMKGVGWPLGPTLLGLGGLLLAPVIIVGVAALRNEPEPVEPTPAVVERVADTKAITPDEAIDLAAAAAAKAYNESDATDVNRAQAERYAVGMSTADVDRMTTYAVALGRATACGVSTSSAADAVGRWLDTKMPAGSSDQRIYLPIFMQGVQSHAQAQAAGRSPDTCETVRRQFALMSWP